MMTNFRGIAIFVWFYALDYFGRFFYMDGHFIGFVIMEDSITLP